MRYRQALLTKLYRLVNGYMDIQCMPNTNPALLYGMDGKKFTSLLSCGKAGSHREDTDGYKIR